MFNYFFYIIITIFIEELTIKNEKANEIAEKEGEDIETDIEYENKTLFNLWNGYCKKSKIISEMNIIQFGIKTTAYIKTIQLKTFKLAIKKDSKHSKTTIYFKVLREYFDILNTM